KHLQEITYNARTMRLRSQPLDAKSGVIHRAWSPEYTPRTGDRLQVSQMPNGGSQNEISLLAYLEEVRRRKYMTVQEALNKATEGGYHIYGSDGMDTDYEGATNDYSAWTRKDNESSFLVPTEETFLDPQFWQALGCALGWSEGCDFALIGGHEEEEGQSYRGSSWMYQWHCFIQALADGKT